MKLPSLEYLIFNAKSSLLRFPLTLLSSFISVIVGIYLFEYGDDIDNMLPYINIMLCGALGIPLYFCTAVLIQKKSLQKKYIFVLYALASVILTLLYLTLPDIDITQNRSLPYIRYTIYNITIHLLVSFVPFIGNQQLNGFWNYNKLLFVRFWVSILYSGFLYVGLILALFALKTLFDVNIHDKLYFDLFILISGFFNTWFFISGIPNNFDALDSLSEYPKGLKVFAQYILLPLLALYLLILYGYGSKIVFLWDWPKGIVSYLIACVAVLGILTTLLLYPYGHHKDNGWIKTLSKWYYYILIPLIIILFIAIGMRVNDYGITINRYIILLLGLWLTLVCVYYIIGNTNIKFIPTSLAIILILVSFGPWGMFSISEYSQSKRLKLILSNAKIIKEDKVQKEIMWSIDSLQAFTTPQEETNEGILSDSLHNEVKSILDYLDNHHGFSSVKPWYYQNLDSMIKASNVDKKRWEQTNEAEIYMRTLGLAYRYKSDANDRNYVDYNAIKKDMINVIGYDYIIPFTQYGYGTRNTICTFKINSIEYSLICSYNDKDSLILKNKSTSTNLRIKHLINTLDSMYKDKNVQNIPLSNMQLFHSTNTFDMKIEFDRISTEGLGENKTINSLSGNLFIKLKP